jgi:tRNA (cytidine/uridine-2'-O-)-methyltransferase
MNILLHAPRDFNNLCVLVRTLECFGVTRCAVYDPHQLVRERYGRSYARRLQIVSAGAFPRVALQRVEDSAAFIQGHTGRSLATVPAGPAESLCDFRFAGNDLLVLGAETAGLPAEVLAVCTHRLTIPQAGVTQSLNLAVAAGVFLWEWRRQQASGGSGDRPASG